MPLPKIFNRLIDLVLPTDLQCVACDRYDRLVAWRMCQSCVDQLEALDFELPAEQYHFRRLICCYYYDDFTQRLVYAHKEGAQRYYAAVFAEMLAARIVSEGLTCDAISWIPTAPAKIRRRGCDHARDIASALANQLNWPLLPLLQQRAAHREQKRLTRTERAANMASAFNCDSLPNANFRLLLIDDVMTTGATLKSAARAILERNPTCQLFGAALFYIAKK